jgi:hypothetical protein
MPGTPESKNKIKSYITHYLYSTSKDRTKINKSKYFTDDEKQEFKKFHKIVKTNVKLIEQSIRLLRAYSEKENTFYKNVMNKLYVYEVVDIDARTVTEYNVYSNPVVGNHHNIKEQARVLHVLNSIMNSNHIENIDPNFKSAKSIEMKGKLLVEMLDAIVSTYLHGS